jgi:hypothetical protein
MNNQWISENWKHNQYDNTINFLLVNRSVPHQNKAKKRQFEVRFTHTGTTCVLLWKKRRYVKYRTVRSYLCHSHCLNYKCKIRNRQTFRGTIIPPRYDMMQYARYLQYVSVPPRYAVPRIIHRTAKAAYPRYDRTANVPLWYARTGFFLLVRGAMMALRWRGSSVRICWSACPALMGSSLAGWPIWCATLATAL